FAARGSWTCSNKSRLGSINLSQKPPRRRALEPGFSVPISTCSLSPCRAAETSSRKSAYSDANEQADSILGLAPGNLDSEVWSFSETLGFVVEAILVSALQLPSRKAHALRFRPHALTPQFTGSSRVISTNCLQKPQCFCLFSFSRPQFSSTFSGGSR